MGAPPPLPLFDQSSERLRTVMRGPWDGLGGRTGDRVLEGPLDGAGTWKNWGPSGDSPVDEQPQQPATNGPLPNTNIAKSALPFLPFLAIS